MPTGLMMTRGWLVKTWLKVILTKQPATVLVPVLMVTEPAVSDPLSDVEPPFPNTALLATRLGDEPVKLMWLGTSSVALPLKIKWVTVICDAVTAPLNDETPATFR